MHGLMHPGHPLEAHDVLGWWTFDPWVIASIVTSSTLYARGVRASFRDPGPRRTARRWEAAAFAAGELTLAIALLSPSDKLSDILFSAHMTQHELLMVVAAPLLVIGRPLTAMLRGLPSWPRARVAAIVARPDFARMWRVITGPILILVVHGLVVWAWHARPLFEWALRDEFVHAVQHLTFFVTAALFWWSLLHGRYGRPGYGIAVLFVFATAMHTSILGVLLSFGERLWYPSYEGRGEAWGVDAISDQQLAGLIMWIPAGGLLALAALGLFAAWLGESERRGRRAEGS